MTGNIVSGPRDAQRAAKLAIELTHILALALTTQDDGEEVVDIAAWKDAGIPTVLRAAYDRLGKMLQRLERTP
jgi:hypothetical protein